MTHTRLQRRPYTRGWSEPVNLPLLLSQTNFIWSLAALEADSDSATNDMVTQRRVDGKPKFFLRRTHTRL
jgi:hypothetical protein